MSTEAAKFFKLVYSLAPGSPAMIAGRPKSRCTHGIFRKDGYLGIMNQAGLALLLLGAVVYAQPPKAVTWNGKIELPNVEGRIDHFSADVKGHRLFLSALGNHTVEVLDIQNGKRLHTITNLEEPQGVLYDAASNHLFAAGAKDGTTKVFDGTTFQLLTTVKFSGNADNVRYDGRNQRIVVGYDAGALGVLDANGKRLADIPLDAHPESFQLEKTGTRVFVNVPN